MEPSQPRSGLDQHPLRKSMLGNLASVRGCKLAVVVQGSSRLAVALVCNLAIRGRFNSIPSYLGPNMPRNISTVARDPRSDRIRQLEDELYLARRAIVELMPDHLASVLKHYHGCQSHDDFWRWKQVAIDAVIEVAVTDPEISYHTPRGWCPLCRGGTSGPYDRGYALAEGLRRHLDGHGSIAECPVTKAAFGMARDSLRGHFDKADQDAEARLLERRRTEPVFLTNPNESPHLSDDGWLARYRGGPGSADMKLAEERLQQLGFAKEIDGNVTAWRLRRDGWSILADPRSATSIEFIVFRDPTQFETRPLRARKVQRIQTTSFQMLDSWKHDIAGKFTRRLDSAIQNLEGASGAHRR
jgi:hypothetical protein